MPKIPKDLSGKELVKLLRQLGYEPTRQTSSHIRLTAYFKNSERHITIPDHDPIKIGTLNNILKDIANHLKSAKQSLINRLFGK
ncbi:MAG: type II toxin-antitoxin system HicA family toxin [Nitrospirae bacterium]|nr:type II toxin-antitoxin system HicA family toxin [Nitrospirota bacterium]